MCVWGGGGGAGWGESSFAPTKTGAEKVLPMLKGGHNKFLGNSKVGHLRFSHAEKCVCVGGGGGAQ